MPKLSRRTALGLGAASLMAFQASALDSVVQPGQLKPNEYVWMPEIAPRGAVAIIVSIPDQMVHVYRGGIRIGVSSCSTGMKGHITPTGVFTILQKNKDHYSNLYDNAPMPNMQRLTWGGIAIHAGHLPGYPASHGCIRLPRAFSDELFRITHLGTPVIISGDTNDPWSLQHPGMVLTRNQSDKFSTAARKRPPTDWKDASEFPVVTLIASSADRKVQLLQNGSLLAESPLYVSGSPRLGEHVLMLEKADAGYGVWWRGVTTSPTSLMTGRSPQLRIDASPEFTRLLPTRLHEGSTFVITDYSLTPDRRSNPDFTILTS
ncbi:MAG: L,D-transpeptidase [Ponticaulis sp.]|nr:L,D-transpeptidase [Ponticaulis sp.]|tara:strand:+ start:14670 stop:15626 length:957 start_codon:yes stop_codon:yes gene_type:complete